MDRSELELRDRLARVLDSFGFEEILAMNDSTIEDVLVFLYREYGLELPEVL